MITCYLRYVIDPYKLSDFERYSRMIMPVAVKYGGTHHGTFLPHEELKQHRGTVVQLPIVGV